MFGFFYLYWCLYSVLNRPTIFALKIKFKPSESLIYVSNADLDTNLVKLTLDFLHEESFWPLLKVFCEAKYFDFESVLKHSFTRMTAKNVQRILVHESFPRSSVLTADLILFLNENFEAFKWFPLEFFSNDPAIENPLDSKYLENINYSAGKNTKAFLKLAFERPSLLSNWNVWGKLKSFYWDQNWRDKLWRLTSFHWISSQDGGAATKYFLPIYSEIDLVEDSAIEHVMKVISMVATSKDFRLSSEALSKYSEALSKHLNVIEEARSNLPMRNELILLIKYSLGLVYDGYGEFCINLASLTLFCQGKARASWLLNIIFIWEYFHLKQSNLLVALFNCLSKAHSQHLQESHVFLDTFFKVFFSQDSLTTAHDVLDLFRFISKAMPYKQPFDGILELIIKDHFPKNPKLAEKVLLRGYGEFPQLNKLIASILPLDRQLSLFYKRIRTFYYTSTSQVTFNFDFICGSNDIMWVEVIVMIKKFKETQNFTDILPFYSHITFSYLDFDDRMPMILKMFFHSLTLASAYWRVFESPDGKPILVPSLALPPQILGYVGFLMGRALSANIEIPFILHQDYFNLADLQIVKTNGDDPSHFLNKLYPKPEDRNFHNIEKVIQIRNNPDISIKNILHFTSDGGDFWELEPSSCADSEDTLEVDSFLYHEVDKESTGDSSEDFSGDDDGEISTITSSSRNDTFKALCEIAINGSKFLRKGLNEASVPLDLISSETLFHLLFEK